MVMQMLPPIYDLRSARLLNVHTSPIVIVRVCRHDVAITLIIDTISHALFMIARERYG